MSDIRMGEAQINSDNPESSGIKKKPFNGGPAFPHDSGAVYFDRSGLSVRDYIAIQVITSGRFVLQHDDGDFVGIPNRDLMIKKAYEMADAIIEYGEIGK
jgi:hypothetical protein